MTSEPSQLASIASKAVESNVIDSRATKSKPIKSQISDSETDEVESKATVIFAPDRKTKPVGKTVFLAGSIDMGTAEEWQQKVIKSLSDLEITIYNPRRPDWNPDWEQKKSNPPFFDQVTWELESLEKVDVIMLYLAENSASPISLLELGIFSHSKRVIVGCPDKFYRQGNIDIVCDRYGIEMVNSLDALVEATRKRLLALTSEDYTNEDQTKDA